MQLYKSLKYFVMEDKNTPDSKVQGAHMGPLWGRQDPGGPHVGDVNLAIWDGLFATTTSASALTKQVQVRSITTIWDEVEMCRDSNA